MKVIRQLNSTAINSATYDEDTHILTIEFKRGASYDYPAVPRIEFEKLIAAPSAGQYFNAHIKQYAAH